MATEVIDTGGQLWWLGFIVGGLTVGMIAALVVSHHFANREQQVYEEGHTAGWDAAVRAVREGRL